MATTQSFAVGTRVRYWLRDLGTVVRVRMSAGQPVVDVLFDATATTEAFVMGVAPSALWTVSE